jgi:hypothetical protein
MLRPKPFISIIDPAAVFRSAGKRIIGLSSCKQMPEAMRSEPLKNSTWERSIHNSLHHS